MSTLAYNINVLPSDSRSKISNKKVTCCRPRTSLQCSLGGLNNTEEEMIARIRTRMFSQEIEISPSSYDTAWVAMVPSSGGCKPRFPQCLDWIMQNQNADGSWGLDYQSPSLVKDSLSCTLACLLALRKWDLGNQLVHKGLDFIGSNAWAISDKGQHVPIGFETVFPEMINYANSFKLKVPIDPLLVIRLTNSESTRKGNLDYVAEGLGKSWDWKGTLSRQRSNGSLLNSPATTAAALIHGHNDDKCFQYLLSLLKTYKNCVPTLYPLGIYPRLSIIDTLERLGIKRHFQCEISLILEDTYKLWQHKEEDLFADIRCRAMAFRLLRIHEYPVSSDVFADFVDGKRFMNTTSIQFTDVTTILELNKASKLRIHKKEVVLERIHAWTDTFLRQQLHTKTILDKQLEQEIKGSLKSFGSMSGRVQNKMNIEQFDVNQFHILKTAYRFPTINSNDILHHSRKEFNICQIQYQKEVKQLGRWYANSRLVECKFGREIPHMVFIFQAAELIPDPRLSYARMCYAQAVMLIIKGDDFFDCHASDVEALNFMELVNNWSLMPVETYVSPQIEILFTALYNTVNEWAANASVMQGRCVKNTLIRQWREVFTSFMHERDLSKENKVTTLEDYLSVGVVSATCDVAIDAPAYMLGVKFSEEMWGHANRISMQTHVSTILRLLNDIQSYMKEKQEGKQNSVSVLVTQSHGAITEEEAASKIKKIAEDKRIELLQMVLETETSLVPKQYKDLVWNICKISYYSYTDSDEFSSPNVNDVNAVIQEPLVLPW